MCFGPNEQRLTSGSIVFAGLVDTCQFNASTGPLYRRNLLWGGIYRDVSGFTAGMTAAWYDRGSCPHFRDYEIRGAAAALLDRSRTRWV